MSKRTIISAEIRLLNRVKSKKIWTIVAMIMIFGIFTASAVLFNIYSIGAGWKGDGNSELAATNSDVSSESDLDNENPDNEENNIASKTDADEPDDKLSSESGTEENSSNESTEVSTEDNTEENTNFQVPETSLPDVETIEGNDWYNSDLYKSRDVHEVGDSYFDSTIFIGDSRTEGLTLYGGQNNLKSFSYKGLSVDKINTEKCINIDGVRYTVAEAIEKTNYDNYYIQFGINELGWIYVDKFAEDISTLIDVIYEHNPDANVYVSNILPVTKTVSDTDSVFNIENVKKFNDSLYNMCVERGDVIYLDVASSVSDSEGYLPEEASADGKHCNADYCKRIIKYIRLHTYERVTG